MLRCCRRRRGVVVPTAEEELGQLFAEEKCDEMRSLLETSSRAQDDYIQAWRRCNVTIPLVHLTTEFVAKYPRVKAHFTDSVVAEFVALVEFEKKDAFYDSPETASPSQMPALRLSAPTTRKDRDVARRQKQRQNSFRDDRAQSESGQREVYDHVGCFSLLVQGQDTTLRVDRPSPFDAPSIDFESHPGRTSELAVACCELLAAVLEKDANNSSSLTALRFVFVLLAQTTPSPHCRCSYEKLLDLAAKNLNRQQPLLALAEVMTRACQEIDQREQQARMEHNATIELRLCAAERASHVRTFCSAVSRHQFSTDAVLSAINAASLGISADQTSEEGVASERHSLTIAFLIQLAEKVLIRALNDGGAATAAHVATSIFPSSRAFWLRHIVWSLDEQLRLKSSINETTLFAMQRQAWRALHFWLLLTRTALPSCQSHVVLLHRQLVSTALGDVGIGTPTLFESSKLELESTDACDVVEERLWPTALAIISASRADLAHFAPRIIPLYAGALQNAVATGDPRLSRRCSRRAIFQIRCLLAVATHAEPLETVDAFKSCGIVPTLLKALRAPTHQRAGDDRQRTNEIGTKSALFQVDDHVLALASARNGKKRWFPARIVKTNSDDNTVDIEFSSGGCEARVSRDRIRRQRALRQEQRKASCDNVLDENSVVPTTAEVGQNAPVPAREKDTSNEEEDLWFVEIPAHNASFSSISASRRASRRKESLRHLVGEIDIQASSENNGILRLGSSASLSSMVTAAESWTSKGWNTTRQDEDDHLSPIVLDDELHELSITLLLCLCVGRRTSGGELEPSFCAPFPFTCTRSPQTISERVAGTESRRHSNGSADSRSSVPDAKAMLASGRTSFISEPTLSSRSALPSGRSSDIETARSSLLDCGTTDGDALGFHALDTLHRHFNFGGAESSSERGKAVRRIVPRVLGRLKAWKLLDQQGCADGAMRLLRLVFDDARVESVFTECVIENEQSVLGEGRFGTVIAAGENRAAKLVQRERSEKDRSVAHDLFREIAALERLSKSFPGTAVELLDFGVHRECYVLVFERCRGGTLAEWRRNQENRTDASIFLRIIHRIASCVACIAAANIVHLDLKCENVLLRTEDPLSDENALCLGDFGEALILGSDIDVKGTAVLMRAHGTECIQPPEVLVGSTKQHTQPDFVSASADVWSLGCLIFELVSGQKLFETLAATDWSRFYVLLVTGSDPLPPAELLEPLESIQLDDDTCLTGLVRMTLQRDPSARPSADEVASRIRELLQLAKEA